MQFIMNKLTLICAKQHPYIGNILTSLSISRRLYLITDISFFLFHIEMKFSTRDFSH